VDAGDATVSDLQISTCRKNPGSALAKSATILDRTTQDISRSLDETSRSAAAAAPQVLPATTGGTLFALVLGY